jgi:YebC/PmpR family DNA-binding regulatory protein
MSGHNKWSTIKRKKEKTDAQRGKIFTKIGREIVIAVREGGGADPNTNGKLRDVIAKAKAVNMPNDNIMRSVKKAAGEGDASSYKEITYEGYGPGGVAFIVEVVTDNLNRAASDVRHLFDKHGGSLGATGCVSWKFERKGVIEIDNAKGLDEDELIVLALDAGRLGRRVRQRRRGHLHRSERLFRRAPTSSRPPAAPSLRRAEMVPATTVSVTDPEQAAKINKLIDALEDYDDVQSVDPRRGPPRGGGRQ